MKYIVDDGLIYFLICYQFYTSHIYANSPYLELFSITWFVRISLLVVEIQVK